MLAWRIIHNKIPTEDNLLIRGCHLSSTCNLYCNSSESSDHIFLLCQFALRIRDLLANILSMNTNYNSPIDILKTANRGWSSQVKVIVSAGAINVFNII